MVSEKELPRLRHIIMKLATAVTLATILMELQ